MITETQFTEIVKQAKTSTKERKFTQAIELIVNFKDIDVKKGFALNEVVHLQQFVSWQQEIWEPKPKQQMLTL
jgi:large subunit ribosomal protein L1